MTPPLINITTIQELLKWYEINLCNAHLIDARGYRVRFNADDFVHLIQLKNNYGQEPRNRRLAIEEIRRGTLKFEVGKFDEQRARELPWAKEIVIRPDKICNNWQALGTGKELYVKDFGRIGHSPSYRVLACKVRGTVRQVVTLFPRERIGGRELRAQIWP